MIQTENGLYSNGNLRLYNGLAFVRRVKKITINQVWIRVRTNRIIMQQTIEETIHKIISTAMDNGNYHTPYLQDIEVLESTSKMYYGKGSKRCHNQSYSNSDRYFLINPFTVQIWENKINLSDGGNVSPIDIKAYEAIYNLKAVSELVGELFDEVA